MVKKINNKGYKNMLVGSKLGVPNDVTVVLYWVIVLLGKFAGKL